MKINIQLINLLEQLLGEGKRLTIYTLINTIQVYEGQELIHNINNVNEVTMLYLLNIQFQNTTVDGSLFHIELQKGK